MPATADFYLQRAAECARDARETDLANVRDRYLRSEKAWIAMAERVLKTEEKKKEAAETKISGGATNVGSLPWPIEAIRPRRPG